jgi:NAD(P)-dependent dehydrogenase (short-subunit alcohol dehydrogenase family)
VFGCRNLDKANAAAKKIQDETEDAQVDVIQLDLANLDSVHAFADAFCEKYPALHTLINNAGIMAIPRTETADGFEMQFGTNHLGHFALTGLLIEPLSKAGGARVVSVASQAHRAGKMNFNDLHGEDTYSKWAAYGQSKLANLLFIYELNRRFEEAGLDIIATAAHPGYAATNLQFVGPEMEGASLMKSITKLGNALLAQDQVKGSYPTVYAATMPDVRGGDYYGPSGPMEMWGLPKKVDSNARSKRREDQKRLWDISEELTGVRYEALAGS